MISKLIDKDLGEIKIIRHKRAKRCIARRKKNGIELTIPSHYEDQKIIEVFEILKPKIENLPKIQKRLFYQNSDFKTCTFSVKVCKENINRTYTSLKSGVLSIVFPNETNIEDDEVQELIYNYIDAAMKLEAKRILPEKVRKIALQHNFIYTRVRINKSKTRWGSCSIQRNINLSYYCMLLPEYLVDFIILHELCHTIEMNHGNNFWSLLDSVTNNNAKELTKTLKMYSTRW